MSNEELWVSGPPDPEPEMEPECDALADDAYDQMRDEKAEWREHVSDDGPEEEE